MHTMSRAFALLLFSLLVVSASLAATENKPERPFANPFLADSTYNMTHAEADFTPLAGPTGPGRRLGIKEITWKPMGPMTSMTPVYSGVYPNGRRVMWVGGYDRIAKLDADTLEILTTYALGGNTYFGSEEIERHIATMDRLDDKTRLKYTLNLWGEAMPSGTSFYRMLSRDNELYLPHRTADGSYALQVYGEVDASDPASRIELRREWKIPPEISRAGFYGVQMTSDGHVVMVMSDGTLFALSREFTTNSVLKLPSKNGVGETRDLFSAFVRNSMAVDERGGIYIVTRENLHRVQWTGEKLSLKETDGAWSVAYPNELGIGSGTTPALMGWGPKEDHLVVIADGSRGNNMMAFWRDDIPADWPGLPGFDRRVAGIEPVHFGVSRDEQAQIENALVVYGYGAFLDNTKAISTLPDQGSPAMQWMAEAFYVAVPGHEALGGAMIRWDPQSRELKTAWRNQTNFVDSICTVSGATELLYCWGARNRDWTLEAVDWKTGQSAFHYTLGRSYRYSPFGGPVIVAPNGAIDCGCHGGLGVVRVNPKSGMAPTQGARGQAFRRKRNERQ